MVLESYESGIIGKWNYWKHWEMALLETLEKWHYWKMALLENGIIVQWNNCNMELM